MQTPSLVPPGTNLAQGGQFPPLVIDNVLGFLASLPPEEVGPLTTGCAAVVAGAIDGGLGRAGEQSRVRERARPDDGSAEAELTELGPARSYSTTLIEASCAETLRQPVRSWGFLGNQVAPLGARATRGSC
jgi:hypothetical protein